MSLMCIYIYIWISHPKAAEYMLYSSTHWTFSSLDHMLCHQTSLNKFKNTEIITGNFSIHNAMRLESKYKKKNTAENMGDKQYTAKQPIGHWRNQTGNLKNTWDKWK